MSRADRLKRKFDEAVNRFLEGDKSAGQWIARWDLARHHWPEKPYRKGDL